jgi:hypothetical protein
MAGAAVSTLWEPRALAVELGVALPDPNDNSAIRTNGAPASTAEPVNLGHYPTVQAALDNDTGDRSVDTMRVVGACYDAGLTEAQARQVVGARADLAERLAERNDDDVRTCWLKAIDKRQRQIIAADPLPVEHAEGGPPEAAAGMPRLWRATDLKPAEQGRWLAKARLLMAAINLLIGDEGIGKSLLWVWIVAAVTTGKALPEFGIPARAAGRVILVCTEDDWCTTVLPRLIVAGADLAMIQVICTEDDGSGAPVFPRDMFLIAEADPSPVLVVVDAWLDTVPPALSVRDPQQARQALHPWKEVATASGAAMLLLCHTNRVSSANARDRYGATLELRKKARLTLYAQQDDEGLLVVGPEKMNTAAQLPATKFAIKAVQHFAPTADDDGTVPQLVYAGESDMTAREQLAENYAADHGAAKDDAMGWLATHLAAGPRWAADAHRARGEAGFSEKAIKTAKRKLGVESERDTANGPWFWRLPQHKGIPEGRPQVPEVPCRDAWTSGTSGPSGVLLETFQKSPFTSQDSQRTNRDTQRTAVPPGPTPASAESRACPVCGQLMLHQASIERGHCERCERNLRRDGNAA